jgi:peptide/nickel transport system permease protein
VQRYIIRRLLLAIPTLWLVLTLVFLATHVRPSFAEERVSNCSGTAAQCKAALDSIKHDLGTDKPLLQQYAIFLGKFLRGDLGDSLLTHKKVTSEIIQRSPPSIEMGLLQIALSTLLAIPIGVVAAIKQDSWADYLLRVTSIGLLAIPVFFSGPLIFLFCFKVLGWTPVLNSSFYRDLNQDPIRNLQSMAIPVLAGAFATSAAVMRLLRSQMLEVMRQDYVRTATAKGLRQRVVVVRHTLKNAMIPVLTIIGLQTGALIGGNVILEQIFAIPGIGAFIITSIRQNDTPVVAGITLLVAIIVVLTNLLIDLAYAWFDPRIRYA